VIVSAAVRNQRTPLSLGTVRLRLNRSAWLALAAVALAACSSSKPSEKPAALTSLKSPIPVQVQWRVKVGDGRGSYLQPAVFPNAVYAASSSGTVVRVDPASGKEVWRLKAPSKLGAGVGSDGFLVVVAGQRGEIYVYSAEGKLSWQSRVPSDVVTAPLVGHGLVIVRSTDQGVTAFEADTGRKRWIYKRQTPALTLRGPTEMVFSGENVIAGFPGGRLVAIALSNGAARWDSVVSEPKGATEVERLADVLGSIGLLDNRICASSYQGRVACFDATSGEEQWARELPAGAGVAIQDDQLFGIDDASTVRSFALSNGAGGWSNKSLAHRSLSSPGSLGRWLVVGDYRGYVHWIDRRDGQLVGRVELDSGPIVAEPRAVSGGVLVQTQRGSLALLVPQS
jgi:outer membrane protein assembly factor BamB